MVSIYQVTSTSNKLILSDKSIRPEETSHIYSMTFKGEYKINLKCNAISGSSTTRSISKSI